MSEYRWHCKTCGGPMGGCRKGCRRYNQGPWLYSKGTQATVKGRASKAKKDAR